MQLDIGKLSKGRCGARPPLSFDSNSFELSADIEAPAGMISYLTP